MATKFDEVFSGYHPCQGLYETNVSRTSQSSYRHVMWLTAWENFIRQIMKLLIQFSLFSCYFCFLGLNVVMSTFRSCLYHS